MNRMTVVVHRVFDEDGRQRVFEDMLRDVWRRVVEEGRVETTFYAGGINTPAEFLAFLRQPHVMASLACTRADGRPLALGWLTHAGDHSAFAHFCVIGPFRRSAGKAMLSHWKNLIDATGAPLVDMLLGITPEINTRALRLARIMGFETVGTIPRYCQCVYAGIRCGGVLGCLDLTAVDGSAPTGDHRALESNDRHRPDVTTP